MTAAIKTENLGKTYRGKRGKRVEALKGLNLEVQKGEVFGFLGPNGAGKSTTIKLLMGLIFPSRGKFLINGIEGKDTGYKKFVGYLPENPSFYDYLTGEELLIFVGRNYEMPLKRLREKAGELLETLDLHDARKRPIRSYSKGMVQRIGLAQALIHDPEILILDEPMSGLDPLGRILVKELILKLKERGKTIFMSTHILNDIEVLCDRVGIIAKGSLKRVVKIEDLMTKGITGYTVIFNEISHEVKERIKELGAIETGRMSYTVSKENLIELVDIVKDDRETDINLIEPERKGLEELFKEVISEE
ncbi:MAG TPA: ABC transporter ATP-binding protein [Nitrospirae bacterium]|nr:ABC transporter ATP-binding protein [Nitrospirota bacterium]